MRKSDVMKRYAHCPDCGSEMRPSALLCRACFNRAGGAWAPIYRAAAARGEARQTTPDTRHQSKKTNALRDLSESRLIVVLGTSHRVQGSPGYPKLEDSGYAENIQRIIREKSVDYIFEEASGCGPTTAARISDSLKAVRYMDVDPSPELRYKCGIVNSAGNPFPNEISPEEKVEEDVQREELWCKRIAEQDFKSGLVICGCLHTLSITFRLRSAGFYVTFDKYLPHDILCSHSKL
jgi:hypothetical protein